jgi:hypothetical protein
MKKYRVFLYNDPEFMVIDQDSISEIRYVEVHPDFKNWVRRYGPRKPEKYLYVTYDDPYFDMMAKNLKSLDLGITVNTYLDDMEIDQTDMETFEFSLEKIEGKSNLKIKYETKTSMSGLMMYMHPKYLEAAEEYLSEKKKWIRDAKISSLIS